MLHTDILHNVFVLRSVILLFFYDFKWPNEQDVRLVTSDTSTQNGAEPLRALSHHET